ncbi:MAG: SGNH/GDSL hydrolase family protein [Clostridiales bacterium]|nr:SGNH/GDSL hydrolase family protein [Clostridiales bacterium]
MKLTKSEILSIANGYSELEENENGIIFHRMSKRSIDGFCSAEGANFFRPKCSSSSCINFDFYTDSKSVVVSYVDLFEGSSRKIFYFDIYVNDVMKMHVGENPCVNKDGKIEICLDGKLNRVTVFSPTLMGYALNYIEIDDGAKLVPIVKKARLLALGDSITHGYDQMYTSLAYTNAIYRKFDVEVINQAIGGARAHECTLIKEKNIDYVTVAYGTNDWSSKTEEAFAKDYDDYVARLREFYPDAKIFLISPIWRGDKSLSGMGTIDVAEKIIERTADKYGCVYIYGWNLVPHLPEFFSPDKIHPNDLGGTQYAFSLCKILENYID